MSFWKYFLCTFTFIVLANEINGQSGSDRYTQPKDNIVDVPPCPSSAQAINDTVGRPKKCLPRHSDMCGAANACCMFNQVDYYCCAGVSSCPAYGSVTMVIYRGINPATNGGTPYDALFAQAQRSNVPNFDQYPGVRGPPPSYGAVPSVPAVPVQPYQPVPATPAPSVGYPTPAPATGYGGQPQPNPVCSTCMGQGTQPLPGQSYIPIMPDSGTMQFVVPQPGAACSTCNIGGPVGSGYGAQPIPTSSGGYGAQPVPVPVPVPAQSYGAVPQPIQPTGGYGGQQAVTPGPLCPTCNLQPTQPNVLCPTCTGTNAPPIQSGYGSNVAPPVPPQPSYGSNPQPIAPQPQSGYGSNSIPSQPNNLCPTCTGVTPLTNILCPTCTGGQGNNVPVAPQLPLGYDGTGNLRTIQGNQTGVSSGYGSGPVAVPAPAPVSSYSAPQPPPQPSSGYGGPSPVPAPQPSSGYGGQPPVPAPQPSSGYGGQPPVPAPQPSSGYGGQPPVPAPQPSSGYGSVQPPLVNMLCPTCSLQPPPGMPFIAVQPGAANSSMQFVMPRTDQVCSTCAVQPTGSQVPSYPLPGVPSPPKPQPTSYGNPAPPTPYGNPAPPPPAPPPVPINSNSYSSSPSGFGPNPGGVGPNPGDGGPNPGGVGPNPGGVGPNPGGEGPNPVGPIIPTTFNPPLTPTDIVNPNVTNPVVPSPNASNPTLSVLNGIPAPRPFPASNGNRGLGFPPSKFDGSLKTLGANSSPFLRFLRDSNRYYENFGLASYDQTATNDGIAVDFGTVGGNMKPAKTVSSTYLSNGSERRRKRKSSV